MPTHSLLRWLQSTLLRSPRKFSTTKRPTRPLLFEPLEQKALLASLPTGFTETAVASALNSPTALALSPDGRAFVAQQNGIIRVVKNDALVPTPFAAINVDSQGERGLLGIALDPHFEHNNYVYVYYAAPSPISHNRVSRFTADGDRLIPTSEQVLLDLPPIGTAVWHMGGAIHFGPDDKLYISVGDQQNTANPQSLDNPFGKILRINPDGSIPTDNPFYANTTGLNRAIWAIGLRNAFTTAFQPGTGRFFINDVGQSTWEEINEGSPGRNFGWPTTEGPFTPADHPTFTPPLFSYSHADGTAITGGAFYNPLAPQFPSQYAGDYFFADFGSGQINALDLETKTVTPFASGTSFPTNLAVSPTGELYYISRGIGTGFPNTGTGQVFKIQHSTSTAPKVISAPANTLVTVGAAANFSVAITGTAPFTYQWQRNQADIPGATSATYRLPSAALSDSGAQFRVIVTNAFGSATSLPATLNVTTDLPPVPTILSPTAGTTYAGGQVFHASGSAFDPELGSLAASQLIWQIDFHHHTHSHPFLPPTSGLSEISFTIPVIGEIETDVWYRLSLTAIDSLGLATTTYRDILPRTAAISLQTNIPGLSLDLDGQPRTTPFTQPGVIGLERTLAAPPSQRLAGKTYLFQSWSDGGAATHNIPFPATDTTYTALYSPANVTYISDLAFVSSTNGWGSVERNRSNGERRSGDGTTLSIDGVTYAKGLGMHSTGSVVLNLAGKYHRFASDIGLDDEVNGLGTVRFDVWGDGKKLYDSGLVTGMSPVLQIDLNVTGVKQLKLVVNDAGDGNLFDHADWADARLLTATTGPGTTTPPPSPSAPPPANFSPPVSYPTGLNAHGVAAADLNNDGLPDLAAANAGSSTVSILFGIGDGTFNASTNYPVGQTPKTVVAGDLNNDGWADLVTPNQDAATISVLLNQGDGTFAPAVNYPATAGAHSVALADFDADGQLDIAQVGWGAKVVRVFFNRGNALFAPGIDLTSGSAPHSVIAADLNADGKPDLAIANRSSSNVAVLLNTGSRKFAAKVTYSVGSRPHSIAVGDLTGDGRPDLVTANDSGKSVSLLVNKGSGKFNKATNFATGPVPKGVALGDVNGDGRLDILTANTAGNYPNRNNPGGNTISILINLGSSKFTKPQTFLTGVTPFSLTLADFDRDTDLDLATANWHTHNLTILLNNRS
jgi:glucose/arabinose dehydrogenase